MSDGIDFLNDGALEFCLVWGCEVRSSISGNEKKSTKCLISEFLNITCSSEGHQ